jgi:hypothetical protein
VVGRDAWFVTPLDFPYILAGATNQTFHHDKIWSGWMIEIEAHLCNSRINQVFYQLIIFKLCQHGEQTQSHSGIDQFVLHWY